MTLDIFHEYLQTYVAGRLTFGGSMRKIIRNAVGAWYRRLMVTGFGCLSDVFPYGVWCSNIIRTI